MTERERFEAWSDKQTTATFWDCWQAALKGSSEPVATVSEAYVCPNNNGEYRALVLGKCKFEGGMKLYTSPPNAKYTESEVDEMMMKVAMLAYGETSAFDYDALKAIVDKVKAGK